MKFLFMIYIEKMNWNSKSLSEIKKTDQYLDIPRKYDKSKLSKKDLVELLKKLELPTGIVEHGKSSFHKKMNWDSKSLYAIKKTIPPRTLF